LVEASLPGTGEIPALAGVSAPLRLSLETARRFLEEIAGRGPLSADDIDHPSRATTAWGTRGRMVKTVLEKLFFHGRVLIARRGDGPLARAAAVAPAPPDYAQTRRAPARGRLHPIRHG
jgi:hypothetical protein